MNVTLKSLEIHLDPINKQCYKKLSTILVIY